MKKIILLILSFIIFPNAFALTGLGNTFSVGTYSSNTTKVLNANKSYQSFSNYSMQTTIENGTTIKEFINTNDIVFAVNWSGQIMPNLQQLLGQYNGTTQKNRLGGLHSSLYQDSNLVIYKTGNMRLNQGVAYIKDFLPPNFDVNILKP